MLSLAKKILKSDESESLAKKTAKGSLWLLIFRISDQSFRFIRIIILARLLAPSDFGLFGITLIAVSLLETFSQSGFHQALIHKKGDIRPYLDTSFVIQALRGFFLASILFISAPYIASFFNAQEAIPILRVVSLAILIQGLTNIAVVYFSKELQFQKYFVYQISGTIADFLVSVILALIFRNVWALAIGFLAGSALRCIVSYLVYFYWPKFKLDIAKAKELFGYGKWVFGSNIIGFFVIQVDSFFVAKLSGIASLGFYQMAYKIPSILGIEVLAGATFPAYAKIQDNKLKLKEVYLKITKLFAFILMPVAGGIFVIAADFIFLFLGPNWLPSLWPMRILSLSALVWTMAVVSDYMFLAIGKPNIQAKWTSIKLLIMIVFLYFFIINFGLFGASLVVLAGSLVASFGLVLEAIKIIECSFVAFIKNIIFSFVNALIMAVCIYFLKNFLGVGILEFLFTVLAGVVIYYLLTLLSDKIFKNNSILLLKESIGLLTK